MSSKAHNVRPESSDPPDPVSNASTTAKSESSSAVGALLLISQQFGSRALTFIVNQVLLRYLSPELLGASVQLEVYSITVLFFARESLRIAIQRQPDISNDKWENTSKLKARPTTLDARSSAGRTQAIVNLAYVSIVFGVFFAFTLAWLYVRTLLSGDSNVLDTPYFLVALRIYGTAAFVELLAEPSYLVVQQKSKYGIRASAESISTVLRCLVTCGTALWAHRTETDIGVLCFALGQIVHSTSLVLIYYWNVASISCKGGFSLLPRAIYSPDRPFLLSYLSWPMLILASSFFLQSVFKHILTQGDTFLVASLASPKAQGVYALASNYGGLIARLILQPVEEISRNFFGKLLSSTGKYPHEESILKAKRVLLEVLHTYLIISVFVISVGPTIAPLLLNAIAGSSWQNSGAGNVLAKYCYYIPLLAINGITEAFVASVATKSDIHGQTLWMLAFSATFACAAVLFLRGFDLGAEGLVWANVLNMLCRIAWCVSFIRSYMSQRGTDLKLISIIPHATTTAVGLGAYAILRQMQAYFTGGLMDVIKSTFIAGNLLVIIIILERSHIASCYQAFRARH